MLFRLCWERKASVKETAPSGSSRALANKITMPIDWASLAVDSNAATHCSKASSLPLTIQLLARGGDARILCDPANGQNKYGCASKPEPDVLAFGSSTASTITPQSF